MKKISNWKYSPLQKIFKISSVNNNIIGYGNGIANVHDDVFAVSNFTAHLHVVEILKPSVFTVQRRGAITNESAAGFSKYRLFASALFKATIFVILCVKTILSSFDIYLPDNEKKITFAMHCHKIQYQHQLERPFLTKKSKNFPPL